MTSMIDCICLRAESSRYQGYHFNGTTVYSGWPWRQPVTATASCITMRSLAVWNSPSTRDCCVILSVPVLQVRVSRRIVAKVSAESTFDSHRQSYTWFIEDATIFPPLKSRHDDCSLDLSMENQRLFGHCEFLHVQRMNNSCALFMSLSIHCSRSPAETAPEFQTLGSRGPNGQSSVSFLDPKTGVLFYALTNLNAIACWRPQSKFTTQQQAYVYQDNVTMIFPNDLKVIANL